MFEGLGQLQKRIVGIASTIAAVSTIMAATWSYNPYVLAGRIDDNEAKLVVSDKKDTLILLQLKLSSIKDEIRDLRYKASSSELTVDEQLDLEELQDEEKLVRQRINEIEKELNL